MDIDNKVLSRNDVIILLVFAVKKKWQRINETIVQN